MMSISIHANYYRAEHHHVPAGVKVVVNILHVRLSTVACLGKGPYAPDPK
jgi:hypothetical protein